MAGSQLKRLKASLREQGIVGPQQSKKQKKRIAQDDKARQDRRMHRGAVMEGIREQFNPFDLKHAKTPKFEVTSNRPTTSSIKGRPGEAKAAAEEKRRQTLLLDMQHRHKVGGIIDQRFGENDPTMTPEEKMLERFARGKMRSHKKNSMFDLEDDGEDGGFEGLTHGGKSLTFDEMPVDDFEEDLEAEDSDASERGQQRLKRVRAMIADGTIEPGNDEPERKKTKKEVMEEVIAKSKAHKYERQQAKDDDEDLRAELDQELPDLQFLLRQNKSKRPDASENQNVTTIGGVARDAFEKNFDLEVKKLAQDKRAQPADRTKTEEEKAEDESKRLKELEEKRQKRMRGESVSDSDGDEDGGKRGAKKVADSQDGQDEDEEDDFGLGSGIKARPTATELGFDDEDDFIIDDDLVASGSDLDLADDSDADVASTEDDESDSAEEAEEEDEFTRGLLNEEESRNPVFKADSSAKESALKEGDESGLPYTFSCPQSKEEFEELAKKYPVDTLPTIVQRIRALYHPKLDSKNKERLGNFTVALVDFISSPFDADYDADVWPSFSVLEAIIRHIHSLSKMFPVEISNAFRHAMGQTESKRPLALEAGDLVLLTAVGAIFPTSDHFHQVVTPSMLVMSRYLGQTVPQTLADHAVGVYLSMLSLQYQKLAKRYVPEVINFLLNTLCALAPAAPGQGLGQFPQHRSDEALRVDGAAAKVTPRRLNFGDCVQPGPQEEQAAASAKVAILNTTLQVLDVAADAWTGKEAFVETFGQVLSVVKHVTGKKCKARLPSQTAEVAEKLQTKLERMTRLASLSRRPLELHHHRPLAIKTFVPKFEETYDPDKHYDPDRERAEMAKLRAEHKKERKGAMRELRKDAHFMAREKLKAKKAKDEAYEKKFKRIVAEIQSEEGREANEYERERNARKRKNRS
ncbi:nucleolar protein 14 [Geosmithia morbida]|uniref:Nucleolar protein 14 n=1 Tax=Geosmithia morbida TaxID=1094350 RepID=A0A9P4YWX8_9HYPO|nr:nucleolar protein 14 [Geosmithia morbida]KAF4123565.1 nucleolar protein 14 [Geosmithia morbida]